MNIVLKYIKTYIVLIIIFVLALIGISLIPQSYLKKNTQKSANYLMNIGKEEDIYLPFKYIKLFTYTDAIMINTAYSIDNTTPLYSAMVARKNYIKGITKKVYPDTQYDLGSVSKYDERVVTENGDIRKKAKQVEELYDTAYDNIDESIEYARYWHGYLVYLRPLLLIADYMTIRIISIIVFCIILMIFTYLMSKKTSLFEALAFVISFILIGGFFIASSMNEITCFYIAFISSIFILLRYEKIKNINLVFFVIGMITNFIDFFTNPIITLGVPMLVYFCILQRKEEMQIKGILLKFIKISIIWGLGFAATWIIKWILVDMLYQKGIIKVAIIQSLYRTVSYGISEKVSIWRVFNDNIVYLGEDVIVFLMIAMLIYALLPFNKHRLSIRRGLPYILISILPIAWIIVIKNHSFAHAFFVCRNFFITIVAFLLLLFSQTKYK